MTQMSVPFFNYQALYKNDKEEILKIFDDVCSRGAYILQKDLEEFEANLAKFTGVKHAIGVANGTDSLIIALKAAGIKEGDEVIMPSHTYIATAASAKLCGGVPVLVECGADHMVDPAAIEKAITKKTKFIMPVHINGRTCNMDAIVEIANKHNLQIVEDAAQALGSKWKGRSAGSFGAAGSFSFYPAKLLGCYGDGGGLITNDDEMARKIRLLRDHGRNEKGRVVEWGYNSRLDNLQAAVLNFKFKKYPAEIERRREIAAMYVDGLKDLSYITTPPAPNSDKNHFDVFQNFELEADYRDELKAYLATKGIGTIIQWAGTAVHQFHELGFKQSLPITEKMTARFLMLPLHAALKNEEVKYVIDQIHSFYKSK
jgi:dTDP-4-amino-4,6-dideoxygalactose transaminase